jgi:aquaporin Z
VYLAGPLAGAVIAVGIARILRGAGGGRRGAEAAQGTLGTGWFPGPGGVQPGPAEPRS